MESLPVHNKIVSYVMGFHSTMSSYLLDTKLLAGCLKCGRVVSATPYYTLWDKTTPSHINSSFESSIVNFVCCIFRPFCLLLVPIRTQF